MVCFFLPFCASGLPVSSSTMLSIRSAPDKIFSRITSVIYAQSFDMAQGSQKPGARRANLKRHMSNWNASIEYSLESIYTCAFFRGPQFPSYLVGHKDPLVKSRR